jgi:hypothetical protein
VDLATFPQAEGADNRRAAAKECSDRSRKSCLRGKEGSASSHAESATPAGSISEPGVLQSSGDATRDVRQATRDRLRIRLRSGHCRTSGLSGGNIGPLGGAQDPARSSGRAICRPPMVSFDRSRRKPSRRSRPMTKESSALRPHSGKPDPGCSGVAVFARFICVTTESTAVLESRMRNGT